jgi:hypothetical protein
MLGRVTIVGDSAALALDAVAAEFPTIVARAAAAAPDGVRAVCAAELFAAGERGWRLARSLDDAVDEVALVVSSRAEAVAMMTRLQRLVDRRNAASATAAFARALAAHRALYAAHDLGRPLVRADFDHARDAWQWMLRLDGAASSAAQLAALFHDVERLGSEADARVEHLAADYDAFKAAHAVVGAELMRRTLASLPLGDGVVERAADLIARHERSDGTAESLLLNDADALSFFSLNASGYLDYFGAAQTHRKIVWTLARMSPRARAYLDHVFLADDVRALLRPLAWKETA